MPSKKRRIFTPELDREICEYKAKHGSTATLKKYRIVPSVLSRICKSQNVSKKPKGNSTRANGIETLLLLRRARSLIEKEVRAGGNLRASDSYVLLATTIAEGQ